MTASEFDQRLDEVRLERLRRRCRRTQEQVYRCYVQAAWNLALRLTGCEDGAWDTVQDGFVRAFDRAGQLRDGAAFGPWLRRIIVNQAMDQHRRRRRNAEAPDADLDLQTHDADPRWLDLERALARLGRTDRTVLWLHDAEGMTHDEIAELAGRTRSWSKSRLMRARRKMQTLLAGELRPAETTDEIRTSHGQGPV